MESKQLRDYAIQFYEKCLNYLHLVLDDFPEDQTQTQFGEAKSMGELLFHGIATPHFWMKRANRPFEFRAKFDTIAGGIELFERQLGVFKKLLEDDDEVHWTPTTSIPWIMIRSCNHLIHHLGMIIYIRNILGLPPIKSKGDFDWETLVDFTPRYHYSK